MHKKSKAAVLAALVILSALSVSGCGTASKVSKESPATTTTSAVSKSQKTTKNGQKTTKAGSTTESTSVNADGTTIAVSPADLETGTAVENAEGPADTNSDASSVSTDGSTANGDDSQGTVYVVNDSDAASVSDHYSDMGNTTASVTVPNNFNTSTMTENVTKSTHIVHHDAVTHEEVVPATYTTIHHDATYTTVHHDAVTHEETVPGNAIMEYGHLMMQHMKHGRIH